MADGTMVPYTMPPKKDKTSKTLWQITVKSATVSNTIPAWIKDVSPTHTVLMTIDTGAEGLNYISTLTMQALLGSNTISHKNVDKLIKHKISLANGLRVYTQGQVNLTLNYWYSDETIIIPELRELHADF